MKEEAQMKKNKDVEADLNLETGQDLENNLENVSSQKEKKGAGNVLKKIFLVTFNIVKTVLMLIGLVTVTGLATFAILRYSGKKAATQAETTEQIVVGENAITENGGKTVIYNNEEYTLNEDISTVLFMGVDKFEYEEDAIAGSAGQADAIIVAAINNTTGEIKLIPISRSTIAEIDEYYTDGSYAGQNKTQIGLSYAYGDGREGSCKNTMTAVSRFLYGMPINQYVSIDLNCIGKLNDEVGGVEVEVIQDLTDQDPALEKGKRIRLNAEQALIYVKWRSIIIKKGQENVDNNAIRMERQKQYLNAFMHQAVSKIRKNPKISLDIYNDMGDDMITNLSTAEILYYSTLVVEKGLNTQMYSIPGKIKHTDHTEVYADKEALYQIVLDTFYVKK